jgi:sugar/nucleoside kinase (ribokinase family)
MSDDKKILTIGEVLVEIVATDKGDGFRAPVPLIGPFPSGAPAIFIDQAGRLGQPAAIISRVGEDDFGHVNLERLAADGVDVSGIEIAPLDTTGSAFVRYRPDGSRAFVYNILNSACGRIRLTDAGLKLIEECRHLHVMGSSLYSPGSVEAVLTALKSVKGRGGTVSFDPNLRVEILNTPGLRQALDKVLAETDIFLPSGDELFLFARARDEAAAVAELLGRGIGAVIVKRGAGGASHYDATGRTDHPGYVVEEVDPTGAGDCFGGAFVTEWLRGAPTALALAFANAAGALAVTRRGPMEGTATRAAIEAFMAGNRPRAV